MPDLVFDLHEALRCAVQQELADSELGQTKQLTDGLDERLRDSYGSAGSPFCDGLNAVRQARESALTVLQELCDALAQFCRHADTAYHNTDRQAAENLDQPQTPT
ncbi:MAG: ESX-1 secretion-associated protein [Mycobacteriaceae bacterium]|nr:ESX-1 secretion-associated protein [Mycobacteriaceae bacterium]